MSKDKKNFQRKVLKNGLTVLFEKRDLPIVSMAYAVRYGGMHEKAEEKGIAHFIEHMLYKGTPTRNAQDIAKAIEHRGGIMNGFTDEPVTAFWVKAPSKHFFSILDVLSDMVKNTKFETKELEKERQVILEEIKMRRDNPMIFVHDTLLSLMYSAPFGNSLIGTPETLSKMNRETLLKKFMEAYTPKNIIFVAVGDVDFKKLCAYLEKSFPNSNSKIPSLPKIVLKSESRDIKRKGIDQAHLLLAYHTPLANSDLSYVATVLNSLLAGGMSSRLFSEIREKRNLAYAIRGDCTAEKEFGYSLVYVGTTTDKLSEVKRLIIEEHKKVARDLDNKELSLIKEQLIGQHLISREDSQSELAYLLSAEIDGDVKDAFTFEKKIAAVKIADVKNLAKISKYSVLTLVPE